MPDSKQSRNRFVKYVIAKDVAAKIKDELMELETTDPPPEPPKETYTFVDVLRGNFELLESIKNKRHKTEVISSIFQKHNLNVTPASINAYMSRIRKELRKKEEALNGYSAVQNKRGGKKKTKAQITDETTISAKQDGLTTKPYVTLAGSAPIYTTGVCDPKIESNNPISVDPVNPQKEEIKIVRNEIHNEDVNTSVAEPCNDTFNTDNNEPVKPLVVVQTKRRDNF